ncbi:hypothetical protein [Pseudoneobacillus rhizosphaerae]
MNATKHSLPFNLYILNRLLIHNRRTSQ